jgi:hypothetical protein
MGKLKLNYISGYPGVNTANFRTSETYPDAKVTRRLGIPTLTR